MTTLPHVAFGAFSDRPGTVFVHLGDVRRHFEDDGPERTQELLTKVAISEFGVPQDEARTFAVKAMADHAALLAAAKTAAGLPVALAAAQAQIGQLKAEKATMAQQFVTASAEIVRLRADVARLSAPAAMVTAVAMPGAPAT